MATSKLHFVTEEEIRLLKPWIQQQITSLLGFEEDTVVAIVEDCLKQNLPKERIISQVKDWLGSEGENESDVAASFVSSLFEQIPKVREQRKQQKRKREDAVLKEREVEPPEKHTDLLRQPAKKTNTGISVVDPKVCTLEVA
jgi:hypothetical protein